MENRFSISNQLLLLALVPFALFSVNGCKTNSPMAGKIPVSDQLELNPLSPTGSVEVGSFVYEDARGYPAVIASPTWIKRNLRKEKQVAREELSPWTADYKRSLLASLYVTGSRMSAKLESELNKIESVQLIVDESMRTYLESEIEITYWTETLDGRIANDDSLKTAIKTLIRHDTKGRKMEVVVETVTITKGRISMTKSGTFDTNVSAELNALLSSSLDINSDRVNNSEIEITADKPLMVGYLSKELPMDALTRLAQ